MDIDVEEVASLAKIKLGDKQKKLFAKDFECMLRRMHELLEVDVEGVPPTFNMGEGTNLRLAEDVPHKSLNREIVLESAPSTHDEYFKVPREPQGS